MLLEGALLAIGAGVAVQEAAAPSKLGIDPVTLLQWSEACRLVDEHEARIWPGYRLTGIPALILNPNVAEVLIGHPKPPADFVRFAGPSPLPLEDEPLFVRRGRTTFASGADTSTPIGGITTLVVTDRGARSGSDDAWNLAVMVHEGFHAWAGAHLQSPAGAELDLLEWPDLDATVAAHLELEGRALLAAVQAAARADASDELEEQALLFLAERARRRARMPPAAVLYEDRNELNEGLASYVEWRAYELWAQHGVGAGLPDAPTAAAFRARAEGMANMLGHSARGTLSINGSAFGPGAVRRRGYFFGAAIGKLLDRLAPSAWKEEVARGGTLTALLREALGDPADAELAERADAGEREAGFAALIAAKETLAAAGRREREQRIAAVLEGAGTLLVIDVSALAPRGDLMPSNWNPFGVLRVDDHRRLYSQTALRFEFGAARVDVAADVPVIVDTATRELLVRTPARAADVVKIEGAKVDTAAAGPGRTRLTLR